MFRGLAARARWHRAPDEKGSEISQLTQYTLSIIYLAGQRSGSITCRPLPVGLVFPSAFLASHCFDPVVSVNLARRVLHVTRGCRQ